MRKRLFPAAFLVIVTSLIWLAAGCSTPAPISQTGSIQASIALQGPQYTYPVISGTVEAAGRSVQIGVQGTAAIENVPTGPASLIVKTSFLTPFARSVNVNEATAVSVELPTPATVNDDYFKNMLFWSDRSERWEAGSISVFFDYSNAGAVTPQSKSAWESQALAEFNEWSFTGQFSFTRVSNGQADVTVYFATDSAFDAKYPGSAGTAAMGGWKRTGGEYITGGDIWVRTAYAGQAGLYRHEMGHVLGIGHPASLNQPGTVMAYAWPQVITGADKAVLGMKMSMPPSISYLPGRALAPLPAEMHLP